MPQCAGVVSIDNDVWANVARDGGGRARARCVSGALVRGNPPAHWSHGVGGRSVRLGRVWARMWVAVPGRGVIAGLRRWQRVGAVTGVEPLNFEERDAAHHATERARAGDVDAAGSEELAGETAGEFRGMGAEHEGECLAIRDESRDEREGGQAVEGCGSAGPSPR